MTMLSTSYVIGVLLSQPCDSHIDHRPAVHETVAYKCPFDEHKLPPMAKKQTRITPTYLPIAIDRVMEMAARQKNPYRKYTSKVTND